MTVHSLSPAFLIVNYSYSLLQHHMTIPTFPSGSMTPGVAPNLLTYAGTPLNIGLVAPDIYNALKPFFHSDTLFQSIDVWSKPSPDDDPVFVWSETLVAATGSGSTANKLANQSVLTWRTDLGGIAKAYLMEGFFTPNTREFAPYPATSPELGLDTYVRGSTSVWYGRDNGHVIAPIQIRTKTNDALRKKRNL